MLRMQRVHVLLAVCAGAGALVIFSPPAEEVLPISAASNRQYTGAPGAGTASLPGDPTLLALMPRVAISSISASAPRIDLFADRRLPPAPAMAPPMPASQAPVLEPPLLPFTFAGKKLEAGAWEVYVMRGDLVLVARKGERLDTVYRIDSIVPPLMTLTYLPLKTVQTLQIGDVL